MHDLLATVAEFGDTAVDVVRSDAAVDVLRTVLACYEAMRVSEHGTR